MSIPISQNIGIRDPGIYRQILRGESGGVDAHRLSITRNQHESNHLNKDKHRCPQVIKNTWINPTWISMIFLLSHMGLSENSVPLHPMVLLIIIPKKNGYNCGYTPFSDIPFSENHQF